MRNILLFILLPLTLIAKEVNNSTLNPLMTPSVKEAESIRHLTFSGHYRGRVDIYEGVNKIAYGESAIDPSGTIKGNSDDTVYLQQIILGLTYKPNENWEYKLYMYDSRSWGSSLDADDFTKNAGTPDAYRMSYYDDHAELFETYIRRNNLFSKDLTFTLGRQQLGYGDRRIFGPGKWGNTMGWLWDAAHLSYKKEKNFLDVWYGQTRVKEPDDFSIVNKHRYQGVGVYAHIEYKRHRFEPFAAWRNNLHHTVKPELNYYYGGLRAFELSEGFIYDTTFVKQWGDLGNQEVDAYAYVAKTGYQFAGTYKPMISLGYIYASGDKNAADSTAGTFSSPFGANDGLHYGRMDVMFWTNMSDIQAKLAFVPVNKSHIQLEYHHFNLAEANDKWYFFGYKNKPGNTYTHVGDEIDFIAKYKLTKEVDLLGIYGYLKAGDFILKNDIAQNDASKLFVQVMYTF